ncbi:hypothetical protein [Methylobacterium iners]|uniref:Uncharacterized protein n=1 Tax=Methylobacterium iners TaxID=418707 RepID=A0ABQ4S7D7_9HYPH|nr:hypothetical protein [Methylobacterium iners]GJD97713.1 hypothetical protein OCOJLMKI_4946 [Methylobacterium iners]
MSPKVALTASGVARLTRPSLAKACALYDAYILDRLDDDGPPAAVTGFVLGAAIALLVAARGAYERDEQERGLDLDLYKWIDLEGPPPPVTRVAEAR